MTFARPDHINDAKLDPHRLDVPEAVLLGERQLEFLDAWARDWTGAEFIEARINGTDSDLPGFVFVCHIQEEKFSANDNSSGCASVLEIGRYSVFISGEYENLDKDKNKYQDGYD